MEMFYINTVPYGSHQPPMAIEGMRCDKWDRVRFYLILINSKWNLNNHMQLVASVLVQIYNTNPL